MTINELIEMLNQVKTFHPDGGNAEVFYEHKNYQYDGSIEREYLDMSTFGMGENGAVLLK